MSNTVKVRPDVYGELANRLDTKRLKRNEPLAQYTTFKIGGPADYFYDATSADDLAVAVNTARELGLTFFVLGLGANILVGDKGFRGLVIRNTSSHLKFSDDGRLWVESGAVMAKLIPQAVSRNFSGLEHYVGIPSTVGGAVWQVDRDWAQAAIMPGSWSAEDGGAHLLRAGARSADVGRRSHRALSPWWAAHPRRERWKR